MAIKSSLCWNSCFSGAFGDSQPDTFQTWESISAIGKWVILHEQLTIYFCYEMKLYLNNINSVHIGPISLNHWLLHRYPYIWSYMLCILILLHCIFNNWRSSAPTATNIDVRSTSRCLWRNPCIKPSIVGRGGNGLVLHAPRPFCQKYSWKWCCQGGIHTIHRPLNQSNGQFLFRVDVWHQLKHAIFMFVSLFFSHVDAPSVYFLVLPYKVTVSTEPVGSWLLRAPLSHLQAFPNSQFPWMFGGTLPHWMATMWFEDALWHWTYSLKFLLRNLFKRTSLYSGYLWVRKEANLWPNHSFRGCFACLILRNCCEKQCYLAVISCFPRRLHGGTTSIHDDDKTI